MSLLSFSSVVVFLGLPVAYFVGFVSRGLLRRARMSRVRKLERRRAHRAAIRLEEIRMLKRRLAALEAGHVN